MQKRRLGQTDLWISPLGLGTVKFGRNEGVKYPHSYPLPTDKEIVDLLTLAYELDINLLDTAPAYGFSEERIGKCLPHASEWIISTKVGEQFIAGDSRFDFSKQAIETSIHSSLARLRRDVLDIVLVHSNGEDIKLIEEGVFETLGRLKEAGKVRAYGMSTKTLSGGLLTLDHTDLAMVTYHEGAEQELEVIRYADQLKKGILIKKAFASGHLTGFSGNDSILSALKFVYAEPGVSSVIVGTLNPLHLQQNVAACEAALFVDNQ